MIKSWKRTNEKEIGNHKMLMKFYHLCERISKKENISHSCAIFSKKIRIIIVEMFNNENKRRTTNY